MNNSGQIEIPMDKSKLRLLLIACFGFIFLGILFLVLPFILRRVDSGAQVFISVGGIISILFFGFCAMIISRKVSDTSPGMIINEKGFTDNSSGVGAGYVPWADVVRLQERNVVNQTFLMVIVKNPEEYINREQSFFKQKAMAMNNKLYGSPISISANTLQISFGELYRLFANQLEKSAAR